jgi:DNA polymerase III sliding clamp (beta) subunit (PCNA family)
MEFSIPVGTLQNIVNKVGSILKLTTDDVTSMIMIDATKEHVKFYGTNGAVHVVITARDCTIAEKGKILIQVREINNYVSKFAPFIDGFGTKSFKITADEKEGAIKTKTEFTNSKPAYRTLKFKLYNTAMLPPIKEFEDAQVIINSDTILEGINKILPCVDPNEIRHAISGVYLSIDKNKLIFAGTNGIKLSEAQLHINADIKPASYVLKYSMAIAMKSLLDRNSQVLMKFEGREIYIRCNDVYLSGGLIINESYPDYKPALNSYSKTITIPRNSLIDNVSAANSVLDSEDNFRLTLTFEGNLLTLKNDRIEVTHEFEQPFEYNFDIDVNGTFLLSMISNFIGSNLEICFMDNNSSVIFKSKENPDHTALLTRLRRR